MRDKFHFHRREDEWELKSNKGFVQRRWCRREGCGAENRGDRKRKRKKEREKKEPFEHTRKANKLEDKARRVGSSSIWKQCQQWAHLATGQKHTKHSINWWTQLQEKYRNKGSTVEQDINVRLALKIQQPGQEELTFHGAVVCTVTERHRDQDTSSRALWLGLLRETWGKLEAVYLGTWPNSICFGFRQTERQFETEADSFWLQGLTLQWH